jgi:hypothetical protein
MIPIQKIEKFSKNPKNEQKFLTVCSIIFMILLAPFISYVVFFEIIIRFFPIIFVVVGIGLVIFLGYQVHQDDKKPYPKPLDGVFDDDVHCKKYIKHLNEEIEAEIANGMELYDDFQEEKKYEDEDEYPLHRRKKSPKKTPGSYSSTPHSKTFQQAAKAAAIQHGFSVNKIQNPKKRGR